jgi:hypothetical protein
MTNDLQKGDIILVQYLYRNNLYTQLWKFLNHNFNTKEIWVYNDEKICTCIKEKNIIKIQKV